MIGERLKLKRQANQMSLRDLVRALEKSGVSITKGALSNYETGKTIPNEPMLQSLALELGTNVEFLLQEDVPVVKPVLYRSLCRTQKELDELESYVWVTLEKRLDIDRVLGVHSSWTPPERLHISQGQEELVEERAEEIRAQWGLDQYPISSISNLLEKQEWDVFELPVSFGLPGISGYDQVSNVPFVYCATRTGVVNLRMQLLEEAARAYFTADSEELLAQVARRFAGAVLFTRQQAFQEFGTRRTAVTSVEITLMKQKYGLPKYEVMHRLEQLGVIPGALYRSYMNKIRQHGYPSNRETMREPLFFYENPSEYNRKVQYAYAEKLIDNEALAQRQMLARTYTV